MELKNGVLSIPNEKLLEAKNLFLNTKGSLGTELLSLQQSGQGSSARAQELEKLIAECETKINEIDSKISARSNATPANMITGAAKAEGSKPLNDKYSKFGIGEKYTIKNYSYPNDILDDQYGGNYVVFYINVSDASRLDLKDKTVTLDPKTEKRMRGSLVAKNMSIETLGGAVGISAGIGSAMGGKGLKETAINAAGGFIGVEAAGLLAPNASRSQRRLKTAIALHIPHQLSIRYGMQWSEEDSALLQGAADAIQGAFGDKSAVAKMTGMEGFGKEAISAIGLNKVQNPGAVSAALGIAANPKKEQTFKGVDFRKFTFDYQFYPRDAKEAENVLNIIQQFKLHMHPEFKSELEYVWVYPSEFDITYYNKHEENKNIHKHTSCVLEEMNVNYTPNGSYQVFENGMPVQINMSLGFKELQVLSKETIQQGL